MRTELTTLSWWTEITIRRPSTIIFLFAWMLIFNHSRFNVSRVNFSFSNVFPCGMEITFLFQRVNFQLRTERQMSLIRFFLSIVYSALTISLLKGGLNPQPTIYEAFLLVLLILRTNSIHVCKELELCLQIFFKLNTMLFVYLYLVAWPLSADK